MKKLMNFQLIVLLIGISVSLFGCTLSTSPNISVLYQIPTLKGRLPLLSNRQQPKSLPAEIENLFLHLYDLDPQLALEVGKLPEFQETIGKDQVLALTRFIGLITHARVSQKTNLKEFMKVGLPNVRRYCTPLQAIFWLLEKNEKDAPCIQNSLNCNWSSSLIGCTENLLNWAWVFSEQEDRWKDYKVVTERLNAPELIDFYEKRRFIYEFRTDTVSKPFWVFKTNRGICTDVTAFTIDCLGKGGYKAWDLHVASPSGRSFHSVTLFEVDGQKYIMDNGRSDKRGIVPKDKYSPF
jgi:hypothetical protein